MTTPFDLRGEIPRGRLIIEASAGTGKTYTVAGVVARLLIETDLAPEQVLVTSFTRAAASELRQRIRARLVDAVRLLERPDAPTGDDLVAAALFCEDATERARRLIKARSTVADFESLSIGTIHSFCQRILRIAGQDVTLDEDSSGVEALIDEVVNDELIAAAARGDGTQDHKRLREILAVKVGNPTSALIASPGLEDVAARIERMAATVRERQARRLSFDALLARAHEVLTTAQNASVRQTLQERFALAVVDEAQDTDPLQWGLLQALFPASDPSRRLIVVGDPKQSIYSFRGADVDGYVSTRSEGATERTLSTNFRSDGPLLDQLNALFGDYGFSAGVHYHPVSAAADRQKSTLPPDRPITELIVPAARNTREIAALAARRVADALAAERHAPRDIAVLVGSRVEGAAVAHALRGYGIAAVTSGTSSVAASEAASELRKLLRVLDDASDSRAMRLAALGWFGDLRAADLLHDDGERLLPFQERLPQWRALLTTLGVGALLERLLLDPRIIDRIAASGRLSRHLTDLSHLAELLHDASAGSATHPAAMQAVLTRLASMDEKSELVTRRIETDAEAVQILTIHAAKGLQWPMVVVAKAWGDSHRHTSTRVPHARMQTTDHRRSIDVDYYSRSVSAASKEAFHRALCAEDDRLFYVAVTRAMHELVVVLPVMRNGTTNAPMRCFGLPSGVENVETVRDALAERTSGFGDRLRISGSADVLADPAPVVPRRPEPSMDSLQLAPAPRVIHAPFRHWSFTVATARRARVAVADELGGEDEFTGSDMGGPTRPAPAAGASERSALTPLPAGAEFGTILHSLFEHIDFASPDPEAALQPLIERFATVPSLRAHHSALARGIAQVLRTPLGAAAPLDLRLADIPRADRIDELRFELALPDAAALPLTRIGGLLRERLPSDDPLSEYAAHLAAGALPAELRGMLNGAIDLIVRHPQRRDELLIVDYKSNRLASYGADALRDAMIDHHYPLQGLLYSVAMHRWLRWRTGMADPSANLAGFAYLFVRGMVGPDTPVDGAGRREGVFHWQAPPGVIAALSDLLAREVPA